MTRQSAPRNEHYQTLLDHIEADGPCTYTSLRQWACAHGVGRGLAYNLLAMCAAGDVEYSQDRYLGTIIEATH